MSIAPLGISILSPSLLPKFSTHVVTTGQIISGVVIYVAPTGHPLVNVTITFSGHSNTTIKGRNSIAFGNITTFTTAQTLHSGELPVAKYEWPFTFTMPSSVDEEPEKKWPVKSPWGKQLPPSMKFTSFQTLGNDRGEGAVTYNIEAVIEFDSGKSGLFSSGKSKKTTKVDLYYLPSRVIAEPDPKIYLMGRRTFSLQSAALNPSAPEKSSKFKSLFKKNTIPKWQFMIAVNVPEIVYVGGPLPIFLSFMHNTKGCAPDIPAPAVTLKACKLTLINNVVLRAKGVVETEHSFSTSSLLSERKDLSIVMDMGQRNNVSELLELPPVQTNLGVSFNSLNITQYCKLRMNLILGCADKTFDTEFDSRAFHVLSPVLRDGILGAEVEGSGQGLLLGMQGMQESLPLAEGVIVGLMGLGSVALGIAKLVV